MNFFVCPAHLTRERAAQCFPICRNSGWPQKIHALFRGPCIDLDHYLERACILLATIVDLVHHLIISIREL